MQSNIVTLTANLQNLENEIKAEKNNENGSRDKKNFKSAIELNPDDFIAIFEFLNTGTHYEAKREPKNIPRMYNQE